MPLNNTLKVFSGSSNPALTTAVCKYLGISLGQAKIDRFPDGEKVIRVEDDVRGKDCFVVQSTCKPVDEHLVELLIYLDCLRRASASRITAVIPYFGYARQDRKDEGRVPITAKLAANLITCAGANRVLAIDLHAQQLQGFFDIPVDHLTGELVLSKYFKKKKISNLTVVSPDVGNIKTASRYTSHLGGELAIVHKRRVSGSEVEAREIIGDVKGRNILMCDDIIATAGTVCSAAKLIRQRGAEKIYVGATHGVFAGEALKLLSKAPIDEVVVTDTIPQNKETKKLRNIRVLTVSAMLGEAIKRIHKNESVSNLFEVF
ncbi:MAG: ribose-phosphate pyrophosphokinase [Phycisphaerae bacterium]|nr:ribose-phosphate pyrophosphokinase [Phycisphaerae bacterium]MDD5380452.1 ribose-phosphate pyrophosphokinase [Phycisphaerae bacterium]